jgi:hypothetical protein
VTQASEARGARVERVIAAGRRAADPSDPLGREARAALEATSGLSPEGVALVLRDHLETHPDPAHIEALLDAAGDAPRCHVVLAANVCTAALRALAVATATAPSVVVRPSRRDPGLAPLLAHALAGDPAFAAAGGAVTCVEAIDPLPGDELHLHGSDPTVGALGGSTPPGVVVRAHGTGIGLAVVGAATRIEAAAAAVARDVVPFDQRGCLSPRIVLVEGDGPRAGAFAAALHDALAELSATVPRGPLDGATIAAVALYRASLQAVGDRWEGDHHLIGLDPDPRALVLPPPARVVHVVPVAGAPAIRPLVSPLSRHVTSVGGEGDAAAAVGALAPRARRAPLGEMQRPPLDGPVDRRADPWVR